MRGIFCQAAFAESAEAPVMQVRHVQGRATLLDNQVDHTFKTTTNSTKDK